MNQNEAAMLVMFLERLGEYQSNAGCNDLIIPNTPENLNFITDVHQKMGDCDDAKRVQLLSDNQIITYDFYVLGYLKSKIMQEHNLTNVDIPSFG